MQDYRGPVVLKVKSNLNLTIVATLKEFCCRLWC